MSKGNGREDLLLHPGAPRIVCTATGPTPNGPASTTDWPRARARVFTCMRGAMALS